MAAIIHKIKDNLFDLYENYGVKGIKVDFEAEIVGLEELFSLKDVLNQLDLDLTVKIGGCEAVKDLHEAYSVGAKKIVAPMIESEYALKKFINAAKQVFDEVSLFINIETKTAYNNLENIISSRYFDELDGVVIGRGDLTESLDLERHNVNSSEVFNIALDIINQVKTRNKTCIIGGHLCPKSIDFFNKLPDNTIDGYETRNVIFDYQKARLTDQIEGIVKALEFEILWTHYKYEKTGLMHSLDKKRLKNLEDRIGYLKIR